MSDFVTGPKLTAIIKEILAEDDACAAVAFWGRGSEDWVRGKNVRIIANLRMGGTNPRALKMVRAELLQYDRLHAKVYIGAHRAVVSSANSSINGLALEGSESASWLEAGLVTTKEVADIKKWFEELWQTHAQAITKNDWKRAEAAWNLRPAAKPTISFSDFDPKLDVLPLTTWITDDTWTINQSELEQQIGTSDDAALSKADRGIIFSDVLDERVLRNRWVLCWTPAERSQTATGTPFFARTSNISVERGLTMDDSGIVYHLMLAPDEEPNAPFDPTEKRFVKAFKKVLANSTYEDLFLEDIPPRPWFVRCEELMPAFWSDVKQTYEAG